MNRIYHTQVLRGRQIRRAARHNWETTFDAIDDWIAIINLEATILKSNRTVEKYFSIPVAESIGQTSCSVIHGTGCPVSGCPLPRMRKSRHRESAEVEIPDGRWMFITLDPIFDDTGRLNGAVHITRDITKRIRAQQEREDLVRNLQKALVRVKTLSGLIPICANCKKIRDDKGYWNLLESYIESHSDALFSHGICPACADELYGDEPWYWEIRDEWKG